jgi:hypothetical protein
LLASCHRTRGSLLDLARVSLDLYASAQGTTTNLSLSHGLVIPLNKRC